MAAASSGPSDVVRKDGAIAARRTALAVVIALPWLLLWSADGAAEDRATPHVVKRLTHTTAPQGNDSSAASEQTSPPPPVDQPPTATPVAGSRPPAIAPAPSPASVTAATDERLVAATLRRFADAYEQLDIDAVAEVWPHADRRVLTRAFDSIESQDVYFDRCDVQISESKATASCGGWLTYVPKVGRKAPRSLRREWSFALDKGAGEWRITKAAVR